MEGRKTNDEKRCLEKIKISTLLRGRYFFDRRNDFGREGWF